MRVLLITDIHGKTGQLRSIVESEAFDTILCAGDLSDATWYNDYSGNLAAILDILERSEVPVWAVPGNTDPKEDCITALRSRGMNLHNKVRSRHRFAAVGYGAVSVGPTNRSIRTVRKYGMQ